MNMVQMKKMRIIMLSAALAAIILSGCGSRKVSGETSRKSEATVETARPGEGGIGGSTSVPEQATAEPQALPEGVLTPAEPWQGFPETQLSCGPVTVLGDGGEWEAIEEGELEGSVAGWRRIRDNGIVEVYVTIVENHEGTYEEVERAMPGLRQESFSIYTNGGWDRDSIQIESGMFQLGGEEYPSLAQHASCPGLLLTERDLYVIDSDSGLTYVVAVVCMSGEEGFIGADEAAKGMLRIDAQGAR